MTNSKTICMTVTDESVNVAIPRDSGHCVVAEALKAAIPNALNVSVDIQTIRWSDPDQRKRYYHLTPLWAQELLIAWDQGDLTKVREYVGDHRIPRAAQIVPMRGPRKKPSPKTVTPPESNGAPPQVLGGRPPRVSALSSTTAGNRRREYGLRTYRR